MEKVGGLACYDTAQRYAKFYLKLQKLKVKPSHAFKYAGISCRTYYRGWKLAESRFLMVRGVW